jgi:hypothetical protein
MTFVALLLGMVISVLLLVMKTANRWKPWLAFYFLWMAIPASFYFIMEYIHFYRTIAGKILFIVTLIISILLFFVNKKNNSKVLAVIGQLVRGLNYPIVLMDSWITSFWMVGKVFELLFSKK